MRGREPGLVGAGVLMIALGGPILLLGLALVPTGYFIGISEPEFARAGNGAVLGLMIGVGEGILIGGWGALMVTVGIGVSLGRLWAWRLAVPILTMMTMSVCCAPLSIPGLYLLLRDSARQNMGMA